MVPLPDWSRVGCASDAPAAVVTLPVISELLSRVSANEVPLLAPVTAHSSAPAIGVRVIVSGATEARERPSAGKGCATAPLQPKGGAVEMVLVAAVLLSCAAASMYG